MSVVGILSSLGSLQLGGPGSAKQGLQHLQRNLQSGDLDAAQSSFAALQQAFGGPQNPASTAGTSTVAAQPVNTNGISQVLRQSTAATASPNSGATAAVSLATNSISSASGSGGHARHHFGNLDLQTSNTDGGNSASLQTSLLNQIGQALASGNLSAAQQASAQLSYAVAQSPQLNALTSLSPTATPPVSMLI